MPDELAVARSWLLSVEAVTDLVGDRIMSKLPAELTFPFVRLWVAPGGGITVTDRVDRAVIDVHVYGDPADANPLRSCRDLAATVRAAWGDAGGYIDEAHDAVVLRVEEITRPHPVPDDSVDPAHPFPRWVSTIAIHLRPNP